MHTPLAAHCGATLLPSQPHPYNLYMAKKTTKKKRALTNTIALNKRAKFDYHLEERFEAGLVLEGWEVKSMRAGKAQLPDSYVLLRNG